MKKQLLLALAFLAIFSQAQEYKPGEILVRFKKGVNPETIFQNHLAVKVLEQEQLSEIMNIWRLKVDVSQYSEQQLVSESYRTGEVLAAQLNRKVQLRNNEPNDPRYAQQWQYYQANDKDIDADEAWEITTGGKTPDGHDIVVAIVDDGLETNHPDMQANLYVNTAEIPGDGIDNDGNGYIDDIHGWNVDYNDGDIDDYNGHGTPVAGIVGAKGNNNVGVAGVNWDVKLMIIVGGSSWESEVIKAYEYPMKARIRFNETGGKEGAFVVAVNSSWGVDYGQPDSSPLWCAMYDEMGSHGILNAGATANNHINVDIQGDLPTACPSEYLISVTNTNKQDLKEYYAGYGVETIDLGAPGADAYTVAKGGNYEGFGGTSGATPHVSGTIALLYSAPCSSFAQLSRENPSLAAQKVRDYIFNGVDPNPTLQGVTKTGGRLNVNNAVRLLMDECEDIMATSDFVLDELEIYPNPTADKVNFRTAKKVERVMIYSIDGKLISESATLKQNSLDLSQLPQGVYELKIKLEGRSGLIKKKVIKK